MRSDIHNVGNLAWDSSQHLKEDAAQFKTIQSGVLKSKQSRAKRNGVAERKEAANTCLFP